MRNVSPDLRTLPSSTFATLSLRAISAMSTSLPLNENEEVRAMTRSSGTCARRLSSSSEMPSAKYSCSLSALMFTKGSTAIDASVAKAGALGGGVEGDCRGLARALEVPEDAAAEQKQQREDRQLAARDLPLAAVAVVPGEDECDGETDEECEAGEPLHLHGPAEERADVCKSLLESPRAGGIGQPPLHQLPAAQSGPHAFPRLLCRGVGHLPVAAIA